MSKLKKIINQLNDNELKIIYQSLKKSEAHKSAELLKLFRENKLSDKEIKNKLDVHNNAYYTLRSRLNEKIENHIIEQVETPRTALVQRVASINEILHTKNKAIATATLKKLEKELLDYDLSNELTLIYKALKKLNMYSPDYFEYSQLYNRHVAYMLAVDKVDDMMADYFKRHSQYLLNGDEHQVESLSLLIEQIKKNQKLYGSHRLYVYYSCVYLFHKLMVEDTDLSSCDDALNETFNQVESYFAQYHMDTTYHNMQWVFVYLRMLYHYKQGHYGMVDENIFHLKDHATNLVSNYRLYTSPQYFLIFKIERALALGAQKKLLSDNKNLFKTLHLDKDDMLTWYVYTYYEALSHHFSDQTEEAIHIINIFLDEADLKSYPKVYVEVKLLLCHFYFAMGHMDQVDYNNAQVQRQLRIIKKENHAHAYSFMKIIRSCLSDVDIQKRQKKVCRFIDEFRYQQKPLISPLRLLNTSMYIPQKEQHKNEAFFETQT